MKLKDILVDIVSCLIPQEFLELDITDIYDDSRKVSSESLFVVLKGTTYDGAHFINQAVEKGARVIIYQEGLQVKNLSPKVLYLPVDSPRNVLKKLLVRFYGEPSQKVKTIGITGTNGKTTITFLVSAILNAARYKTAVVGTIHYKIGDEILASHNTTPGLVDNQKFLSRLEKESVDYCAMEVSSHALDQGRVDLIAFRGGIFTNLTGDHLDYHKTLENYFKAKALLFENLDPSSYAIINGDDEYSQKLISLTKAQVMTYGINQPSDLQASNIRLDLSGTRFDLKYSDGRITIQTKLFGIHNVYNILAAIACALQEGVNILTIQKAIADFDVVPGRLEKVECGQDFSVFIDYAHTQDALLNVLQTIRRSSSSRIILVFGCGGDRDKTKRPKMGQVASELADFSIVTSDNPRSEDPATIITEIVEGFTKKNYNVVINREEAIGQALSAAHKGDIVLIAGKGHETYQIFKDKTIAFDERQVVRKFFSHERHVHH